MLATPGASLSDHCQRVCPTCERWDTRPYCTSQSNTSLAQRQTRCGFRHGIALICQRPKLHTHLHTHSRHGLLRIASPTLVAPFGEGNSPVRWHNHVRDCRDPLQQDCVSLNCALQMAADILFMSERCPKDSDALF